jgi:hypothetical protein
MTQEELLGAASALRFVLWSVDHGQWLAAGGDPADAPPCPVTSAELAGLAAPLAGLVVSARLELARQLGQVGYSEQSQAARAWLQTELEGVEIAASFAAVDGETAGPQPSRANVSRPGGSGA